MRKSIKDLLKPFLEVNDAGEVKGAFQGLVEKGELTAINLGGGEVFYYDHKDPEGEAVRAIEPYNRILNYAKLDWRAGNRREALRHFHEAKVLLGAVPCLAEARRRNEAELSRFRRSMDR